MGNKRNTSPLNLDKKVYRVHTYDDLGILALSGFFSTKEGALDYIKKNLGRYPNGLGLFELTELYTPKVKEVEYDLIKF